MMEHMMLIPDGDRRYAKKVNISNFEAYNKAAKVVRNLVEWILVDSDVKEFTFFGLSYNNVIKRKDEDLEPILKVQTDALNDFAKDKLFHDNKIKVLVHGQKHLLPKDYLEAICNVESETAKYTNKTFNLLLGYSGERDLEIAIEKTISQNQKINFENILTNCNITKPIDFVVRTANENRLSDGPFYLTKYTEFCSIPTFFPELTKKDITNTIEEYNNRKRTFGV
jgi:tritrans,polycis-undecaprenyl-diphosphate synthase [geranylgeranyl-diphosphate specific]